MSHSAGMVSRFLRQILLCFQHCQVIKLLDERASRPSGENRARRIELLLNVGLIKCPASQGGIKGYSRFSVAVLASQASAKDSPAYGLYCRTIIPDSIGSALLPRSWCIPSYRTTEEAQVRLFDSVGGSCRIVVGVGNL